jgi:hypothetical protein
MLPPPPQNRYDNSRLSSTIVTIDWRMARPAGGVEAVVAVDHDDREGEHAHLGDAEHDVADR